MILKAVDSCVSQLLRSGDAVFQADRPTIKCLLLEIFEGVEEEEDPRTDQDAVLEIFVGG
jgi:hypothetical protein